MGNERKCIFLNKFKSLKESEMVFSAKEQPNSRFSLNESHTKQFCFSIRPTDRKFDKIQPFRLIKERNYSNKCLAERFCWVVNKQQKNCKNWNNEFYIFALYFFRCIFRNSRIINKEKLKVDCFYYLVRFNEQTFTA